MLKKLKRKFTVLATVSMFLLMTVLVSIMNIINYSSIVAETDRILDVLSQPGAPFATPKDIPEPPPQDIDAFIPRGMSPEVPYEARYFTAMVSNDGVLRETDISRIISVDRESVNEYVATVLSENRNRGFINQFRYAKQTDDKITRIIFLDCGRKLDSFRSFMWISIAVGFSGCVLVFALFYFTANRIVAPIAESYAKQKRFITDAGHEIKTPLTIIGANLDLLESDYGNDDSFTEIRHQTKRLGALTEELVYLSKMEEPQNPLKKIEFPVSDVIAEAAQQHRAVALAQNKAYRIRIEPDLSMLGSPEAMHRLVTVLLDNGLKYSPEGGSVTLHMFSHKKNLVISVQNTVASPIPKENLAHLFDRFYRADASRNSETGSHGIGLAIAQAITATHNGKITAEIGNNTDFIITVTLPLQ